MAGFAVAENKDLFDKYKYDEITFKGTVLKSSGIIKRDIFLKAGKTEWPCTVHSASMMGVKLSVELSEEEVLIVSKAPELQVHFSFLGMKPYFIPTSFFVSYRLTELTYTSKSEKNTHLLDMSGIGRPHGFLIKLLGEIIGVQILTTKRAETRITVNEATSVDLGLRSAHCKIRIDDADAECIIQDLSFSGCQVFLDCRIPATEKQVTIEILFKEPDSIVEIPGKVIRSSLIKECDDFAETGIRFEAKHVPHEYSERLHHLLD